MRCALCVLALAGCDDLFNLDHLKGPPRDGDITGDATDGSALDDSADANGNCVGHYLSVCPSFVATLSFGTNATINTSTNPDCMNLPSPGQGYPALCVLAANNISINSRLTVTGSRALVLASSGSITVGPGGVIDASSVGFAGQGRLGPAANAGVSLGCNPTAGAQQGAIAGAGGGAGGSFGGTGGSGGAADNGTTANSNLALLTSPPKLRGGCPGALGGPSANLNSSSFLGNSGGALYLVAAQSITIDGLVMANGSSGSGGGVNTDLERAGGAGGGSGGLIVLDAQMLTLPGVIAAQGGAGGGGADGTVGGNDGQEWDPSNSTSGARGGSGGGGGGSGGDGSSAQSVSGTSGVGCNTADGGAAGGGGGGAGFILIHGAVSQATHLYPAPITLP